jgi:hypothetical protein
MAADLQALKAAIRSILLDQTDAGGRVATVLPENAVMPFITYQASGGPGAWIDWSVGETARIRTWAWAAEESAADKLHTQIRAILLPASSPVNGYRGAVTTGVGTVNIDGTFMNGGPNGFLDPPTSYRVVECFWLVNYW